MPYIFREFCAVYSSDSSLYSYLATTCYRHLRRDLVIPLFLFLVGGYTRKIIGNQAAPRLVRYIGRRALATYLPIRQVYVAITYFVVVCSTARADPPRLLQLTIPGTNVEMRFCYCPPPDAPVTTGRPGTPNAVLFTPVSPAGFYISEAEISLKQLKAVLGEEAVKRIYRRANMIHFDAFKDNNLDYPAMFVAFREAVQFCIELEKMQRAEPYSVAEYRFRLPSHFEWQYACRAGDPKSFPHFSGWPDWESVRNKVVSLPNGGDEKLEKLCEDVWKDQKLQGNFSGTQDDVIVILEKTHPQVASNTTQEDTRSDKPLVILTAFLEEGIGLSRALYSNAQPGILEPSYKDARATGKPNAWGIHHMHTNVSEWAIISKSSDDIVSDWEVLMSAVSRRTINDTRYVELEVAKLGANIGVSKDWWRYTIWHVEKVGKNNWDVLPELSEERLDEIAADEQVGFRVIVERAISPAWLAAVRRAALQEPSPSPITLSERFEKLIQEINDLAKKDDIPKMLPKVDYYLAVAYARAGEKDKCRNTFDRVREELSVDDPFFEYLPLAMVAEE